MKLSEILREETIYLNLTARDKWEVIEKITNDFVQKGLLLRDQKQVVLEALITRENISSTGMENGVALPHASVDAIDDALCAFGISPQGIPFQCQDGKAATLIMLLVVPKKKIQVHIKTLAAIAKLLNSASMRESLLKATTSAQVMAVIKQAENKP
jgi:PTS system fructose-specific IIA component